MLGAVAACAGASGVRAEDVTPRPPASGRRYLLQRQIEERERQRRADEEREQTWLEDRRRERLRSEWSREEPAPARPRRPPTQ
jgi:hypothetical protein